MGQQKSEQPMLCQHDGEVQLSLHIPILIHKSRVFSVVRVSGKQNSTEAEEK